jgi:hypothetical protein
MSGKWVQAENGRDEKLDVYVWVETPEPSSGTLTISSPQTEPVELLGPDGRPLRRPERRRIGFVPPGGR